MKKEVNIGIMGIMALCILYFGINYLKGRKMLEPTNYFYVAFDDVNGVSHSSPVFANGYKIGLVSDIYYDYENLGRVYVKVEADYRMRVPRGSLAVLDSDMLGQISMNIKLNSDAGAGMINPGDTIDGMTNKGLVGAAEEKVIPRLLNTMERLDSVLTKVDRLMDSDDFKSLTAHAGHAAANLDKISDRVYAASRDFPELAGRINEAAGNLALVTDKLGKVDYQGLASDADKALRNLNTLTDDLLNGRGSLGRLVRDEALYDSLTTSLTAATSLLTDIKEHPKRYVHFSVFGRKAK